VGLFEPGVDQSEVIEPMVQRLTGHLHPQVAHLGEVGQSHLTRLMHLAEHDLLIGTMLRTPSADASLQCTADPR
jgi:histidine ammonia-lyase